MLDCPPLLALTDRETHADAYWRVSRPFSRLREAGATADVCWLDADELPTISPEGRVVVLQRVVVKGGSEDRVRAWVQRLRDAGALAVVFELDDDVLSPAYLEYLDACGGLELVKRQRLMDERQALEWAMRACDAVTVSTGPLAEVVRRYTDCPVLVVPNAIDVAWFRDRLVPRPEWGKHLTIGWAGGRRPDADLEPMAVAWGRIAKKYPHVRFVVGGWQPDCIYREVDDLDRIVRVPWRDLDDWPPVMQVDIGCCPLADTPFNRCKSPIKAWEYGMAGAAVVASPTVYGRERLAGLPVLLASDADVWESEISALIEDDMMRLTLAAGLRAHVGEHHRLQDSLQERASAYRQIAEGVPVG